MCNGGRNTCWEGSKLTRYLLVLVYIDVNVTQCNVQRSSYGHLKYIVFVNFAIISPCVFITIEGICDGAAKLINLVVRQRGEKTSPALAITSVCV